MNVPSNFDTFLVFTKCTQKQLEKMVWSLYYHNINFKTKKLKNQEFF